MYRPEIKVIDCSIRDGGLMNNSRFSMDMVKKIVSAVNDSGVDIIELGYRNSKNFFSPSDYGPWRFCDEDVLREAVSDIDLKMEIAVMMDSHKATADDILPREQSVVDIFRIATYVKDVDKAIHLANTASEMGYKSAINIMAMSHCVERELDEALQQINEETDVFACYIVDSFGSLYSEDIDYYVDKYKKYITGKEIGIHCHNNMQLAFANTIEGIIKGVNYLDGTLYGIGRAAGNCPLELLVAFLKNPKYSIRPLIEVIGTDILPLTKEIEWGYRIPYMLTGMLNQHPQAALALMELEDENIEKYDFAKFFTAITQEDIEI